MASGRNAKRSPAVPAGMEKLGELFSSRIRASVLAYLVAHEEERFSLTELSRALELSVSSVQHECYKLERLGVLRGRREGASRRYWLDREQEFVPVLMWLVISVIGQPQVLRYALHGIDGLEAALLADASSEPSLTLIGVISLDDLSVAHHRVAKILDMPTADLKVAFYEPDTWRSYVDDQHPAAEALQAAAPEILVGTETIFTGR